MLPFHVVLKTALRAKATRALLKPRVSQIIRTVTVYTMLMLMLQYGIIHRVLNFHNISKRILGHVQEPPPSAEAPHAL